MAGIFSFDKDLKVWYNFFVLANSSKGGDAKVGA